MKPNVMLTIASLLSILFFTFHLTDDIVRGMEPGTLPNLIAVPILVIRLYGTLVLAERRSGYVIILLLGSLLGLLVPVVHMKGAGVGGAIAKSSGAFFFIWTLLALGVTARSAINSRTREIFSQRTRELRQLENPVPHPRKPNSLKLRNTTVPNGSKFVGGVFANG
jgi:hypothetical protein